MTVLLVPAGMIVSPQVPQLDTAVAANYARADGLVPLDHPGTSDGATSRLMPPHGPRPGQADGTPETYTPGPIAGVVGTTGGQPLPVSDQIHRPSGGYTGAVAPSVQHRLGVGQIGPSSVGAAQTTQLAAAYTSTPVPGSIDAIIAGIA